MKKIFYLSIMAIVAGLLLCTACKKKETPQISSITQDNQEVSCQDSVFVPIELTAENQQILNGLINPTKFKDSANAIACIQTKEEWDMFSNNTNIDLDFDKYFIIYGKIATSSTSDLILSKKLYFICSSNTYEYTVSIQCEDNGFPYFESLCFWEVYSKVEDTISYKVKYIALKQGTKIESVELDEETMNIVNNFFEINTINPKISLDTAYCIQTKDEWLALTHRDINLDFDRYSIIYGRTIKPVSMDTIIYQELYYYPQINNYCFNLIMLHRDGYNVVRYLCFWKIYPKINQPILFNKKYIL